MGTHGSEFVSWDEFMGFAAKADCIEVAHEVKESIEELPAAVAQEMQHEAEEFKQEVAADVEAAEKALQWLKQRFESLVADEDGAVSKEELATKVKEAEDVNGENISTLIGQAGFNPLWHALDQLDTNKDGHISWEESRSCLRRRLRRQR